MGGRSCRLCHFCTDSPPLILDDSSSAHLHSSIIRHADFPNLILHMNPSKKIIIESLSSCTRLNTVRLDADDIIHPDYIETLTSETEGRGDSEVSEWASIGGGGVGG